MRYYSTKPRPVLLLAAAILFFASCKKSDTESGTAPSPAPSTFVPVNYAKGTAQGTAVHKSIGASGGSISSDDGRLTIDIPAGAVNTPTDFTIQPISNTMPVGSAPAYRILPAHTDLLKPVTISLKYTEADMDGCDEDALYLTDQDSAGVWKVLNKTNIDKGGRVLSAQTKHLNDFGFTGLYYLVTPKNTLATGETVRLIVKKIVVDDNTADDESAMGTSGQDTNEDDFAGWEKNGSGSMDASGKTSAGYTAPGTVDNSSGVEIRANLRNIKRSRSASARMIALRTRINIQTENFMAGTYDGQPFNCTGVSASAGGGVLYVQGITATGKQILILVHGTDISTYPYGDAALEGKSEIRCNFVEDVYQTVHTPCTFPSIPQYASGGTAVTAFDSHTIAGDFSATLYRDSACTLKTKMITGSFRARRS